MTVTSLFGRPDLRNKLVRIYALSAPVEVPGLEQVLFPPGNVEGKKLN